VLPCNSATRERFLSMVGGKVHVTSRRIVFTPNGLAVAIGRRSWQHSRESLVSASRYRFGLGRVLKDFPAVRLAFDDLDFTIQRVRLLVMVLEVQVSQLIDAVG
jgi:hypothetical protein